MSKRDLIVDEWRKRKGIRKAALTVLADGKSERTREEHAREVWMNYIRTPIGNPHEKNTSSIEDVSANALTIVLKLMSFARPDFSEKIDHV